MKKEKMKWREEVNIFKPDDQENLERREKKIENENSWRHELPVLLFESQHAIYNSIQQIQTIDDANKNLWQLWKMNLTYIP